MPLLIFPVLRIQEWGVQLQFAGGQKASRIMADAARGSGRIEAKAVHKVLVKTASFENIEELSADLIARGRREVERAAKPDYPSGRARSPAAQRHAARIRSQHAGARADEPVRSRGAEQVRRCSSLASYFASSSCPDDDRIAVAALPPSHSQCLFGVSWLCFVTAAMCVYYGHWDVLAVPLGVGINSVNYWRKVGRNCSAVAGAVRLRTLSKATRAWRLTRMLAVTLTARLQLAAIRRHPLHSVRDSLLVLQSARGRSAVQKHLLHLSRRGDFLFWQRLPSVHTSC